MAKIQRYWKSAAACLVVVIGVGVARPAWAQDTTTLLALFLRDLRNGTLGVVNPITKVLVGDGSASAPSYSFASEPGLGFYRFGSGAMRFVQGSGTTIATMSSSGIDINGALLLSTDVSLSRGAANVLLLASGDSLNFTGVTSSDLKLKQNGAILQIRNGDDTGYARADISALQLGGVVALSSGTPTISSGFGTSPSVTAGNAAAFSVNVGTGGTASSGVIGLPTATTGWVCHVENRTALAANRANQRTVQTAATTTSATVQNQTISTGAALAWTASDVLVLQCTAY